MANDDGGITSPEGVLMLCIAVFFDGLSLVVTIIGIWFVFPLIIDLILDIMPILVIGLWSIIRGLSSGKIEKIKEHSKGIQSKILQSKKTPEMKAVEKIAKKTGKRFGITLITELAPVIGAIIPAWTIFVYKEMGGLSLASSSAEESEDSGSGGSGGNEEGSEKVVPAEIVNKNQTESNSKQKSETTSA